MCCCCGQNRVSPWLYWLCQVAGRGTGPGCVLAGGSETPVGPDENGCLRHAAVRQGILAGGSCCGGLLRDLGALGKQCFDLAGRAGVDCCHVEKGLLQRGLRCVAGGWLGCKAFCHVGFETLAEPDAHGLARQQGEAEGCKALWQVQARVHCCLYLSWGPSARLHGCLSCICRLSGEALLSEGARLLWLAAWAAGCLGSWCALSDASQLRCGPMGGPLGRPGMHNLRCAWQRREQHSSMARDDPVETAAVAVEPSAVHLIVLHNVICVPSTSCHAGRGEKEAGVRAQQDQCCQSGVPGAQAEVGGAARPPAPHTRG